MLNSDEFVRYQPTMHRIQSHDGSSDQNEKVQQGWKFKKSGILTSSKSEFKDYNWFRRLDRSYFFWPVRPLEKHRIENSLWDAAGRFSPSAPPMISNVLSQRDRRYVSPFFFSNPQKKTQLFQHISVSTHLLDFIMHTFTRTLAALVDHVVFLFFCTSTLPSVSLLFMVLTFPTPSWQWILSMPSDPR